MNQAAVQEFVRKNTIWCADGGRVCRLPNGKTVDLTTLTNRANIDTSEFIKADDLNTILEDVLSQNQTRISILEKQQKQLVATRVLASDIPDSYMDTFRKVPRNINNELVKYYDGLYQLYNIVYSFMLKGQNVPENKLPAIIRQFDSLLANATPSLEAYRQIIPFNPPFSEEVDLFYMKFILGRRANAMIIPVLTIIDMMNQMKNPPTPLEDEFSFE